ncbi:MAG: GMC family oxidoreductase [Alphaproteobacteria bacterium]
MLIDFRTAAAGTEIEADLCVIGAGAAGITIAREFAGGSIRVCLVESGGFDFEENTQALCRGEAVGTRPPRELETSRLRYFGGTTNHWAGCCAPLNEIDISGRPWVPMSGWPITRRDLATFYENAQRVCELGPFVYDDSLWQGLGIEPIAFLPEKLTTRFFQVSPPTVFGEVYRPALENAANVILLLNANVIEIVATETLQQIRHVEIKSLDGTTGRVKAKYFVVACGGIENARLLLASNSIAKTGLGNQHDVVGRYFIDHIFAFCGLVATEKPVQWDRLGLDETDHNPYRNPLSPMFGDRDVPVRPFLCLSDRLQEREQVLDAGARVEPFDWQGDPPVAGFERKGEPQLRHFVALIAQSEQAPNPDSRVMLIEEKDALGAPKVRLDWRLSEIDKHTLRVMTRTFATEFGRLGLGRVRLNNWLMTSDQDWSQALGRDGSPLAGTSHHMGATRMSEDPRQGVVDRDCRVHGIDNIYLAGSSVFPASGFANPTLTIVALALRLSNHLNERLT